MQLSNTITSEAGNNITKHTLRHVGGGVTDMSEKEREIIEKLAKVFPMLPADKQEYFLGYAEAVADMASAERAS